MFKVPRAVIDDLCAILATPSVRGAPGVIVPERVRVAITDAEPPAVLAALRQAVADARQEEGAFADLRVGVHALRERLDAR